MRLAQYLTALRAWSKQCLPGRWKPDVLRPGNVGTLGSMVIRLRPCMTMSTPPPRALAPPDILASFDRTPRRLTLGAPVDERDDSAGVNFPIVGHLHKGAEHGVQPSSSLHVIKAGNHHPELQREEEEEDSGAGDERNYIPGTHLLLETETKNIKNKKQIWAKKQTNKNRAMRSGPRR